MNKNLNREFIWHLLYQESLINAALDTDIDEKNLKALMFHTTKFEKILTGALSHRERKCVCPICDKKFYAYLPFGEIPRKGAQCPNCKSLERHRALFLILKSLELNFNGKKILHFAPEPIFYKIFSSIPDVDYYPVDLHPQAFGLKMRKAVDITDITFDDNTFDLIICNHVLEHIPDDKKAMNELYRVLKPDEGIAMLTVPIDNTLQKTFENPAYNTPELRLKYFGQCDHVRRYGLDYADRLKIAGFFVQEVIMEKFFNDKDLNKFGLSKSAKYHVCRKLID